MPRAESHASITQPCGLSVFIPLNPDPSIPLTLEELTAFRDCLNPHGIPAVARYFSQKQHSTEETIHEDTWKSA